MTTIKKCIVLDLDNTLWGGVIGEDGMDGIALSTREPGAAFIAFQQSLKDMGDRGIILAINSQNNPEDALQVIRTHPNMILKEHDFAAMRMNWADKVENMRELARELNIGLDSMVFFDDSPTNREAVRSFLPEVEVPEISDPALYAKILLSLPYFPAAATTDEDKMRGNMYVTERLRMESEKSFADRGEFLKSLGLELFVSHSDEGALPRLSQLTQKTNQFNTDKHPLSMEEIQQILNSPDREVFHARLVDRFGDHGIIALAIVKKDAINRHIEQFLMSCRVFGRGVEDAFLHAIAAQAAQEGAQTLSINYTQTEKNAPAREFVERVFSGGAISASDTKKPEWITLSI